MFGVITFKRHIYGVYCAVITLAESLILQDFIIEYQAYTGGFNGITDYSNYGTPAFLWFILAVVVVFFIIARALTHSRVGTVLKSIRDNDVRAEFMGYNVANYRIFVFCVSAFMAAAAGALYAAWVGIVSFLDAGPVFSIEGVIWTAVGGRGTLIGPFIGTFLVKGAEFFLSGVLAQWWQIIVGGLFIFVVLVLRDGIVGSIAQLDARAKEGSNAAPGDGRIRSEGARPQLDWRPGGRRTERRSRTLNSRRVPDTRKTMDGESPQKSRASPRGCRASRSSTTWISASRRTSCACCSAPTAPARRR